ncbi:hypothetical protein PBY51_020288 [Eleginops maclovinus]|uniref:Uncharacterized protein n=1 Tax=Eleginops maclovinus TaxID=56733 RepID=A0AAN7XLJ2_ELEMC|nr:hypothetical protein PBY51_020288 [Eleginops maclovinus]
MRLLLTAILLLLFLWLYMAKMSNDSHGNPCEAVSTSEAAVALLLSPLSLYSWFSSTLFRLALSIPALVLSSLYHSVLLLLAGPWCVATVCLSLLLTCLHVALYLLHLVLVIGVLAMLILTQHKVADSDTTNEKVLYQQRHWRGITAS